MSRVDDLVDALLPDAVDAGSAEVLDAQILSWGAGWNAADDQEHHGYLDDLNRRIADAQQQVTAAEDEHRRAEQALRLAWQHHLAAMARLGVAPPALVELPPRTAQRPSATHNTMSTLRPRRRTIR